MSRFTPYPICVVFENGNEFHAEASFEIDEKSSYHPLRVVERLVREHHPKVPHGIMEHVRVKVFTYYRDAVDGSFKTRLAVTYSLLAPMAKMSAEDYRYAEEQTLSKVPPEFHGCLSYMAYERGHSAGYSETYSILRELVDCLVNPIREYTARIERSK